jgi:hypothetical protein
MGPGRAILIVLFIATLVGNLCGAQQVLDGKMHHLRSGAEREWDEFPQQAEGKELVLRFDWKKSDGMHTLRIRQRDVKQPWAIRLNEKEVGVLLSDEKDTVIFIEVLPEKFREGQNELKVLCKGGASAAADDVMVGQISLFAQPSHALKDASLEVEVVDTDSGSLVPARLTFVDQNGSLIGFNRPDNAKFAGRPGVIYTPDGRARFSVPAGKYTIYAGRGFEYSIASLEVNLEPGETVEKKLAIRRVVSTPGYVSCDPHIHTFTYSRHGDASIQDRMYTLAGENVELAIATDHNLQVDFAPEAEKYGVSRYFTSVIGNEVTTASQAHFNVFPIPPESKLINFRAANWDSLSASITEIAGPEPVIILNHARDIHGGFRPHDPKHFIAVAGQRTDGRKLFANAMEVVNSGAVMSDPLRLYKDWFGLLNRGHRVTPVGASDSHDVSRYIVGQARTYIRCDDSEGGKINIDEARKAFLAGKVLVSYGLLTDITVNGKFYPGDLVPAGGNLDVQVTVQAPPWSRATHLTLYANGTAIRSVELPPSPGRTWQTRWSIAKPKHDIHLVAIATGPGIAENFWQIAKPYQPTTTAFAPYVLGSTGAVFIDADGSRKFESAHDYATKIMVASDVPVHKRLADFDEAVAAQVAAIFFESAGDQFEAEMKRMISSASPVAKRGLETYLAEWREHVSISKTPSKN